jgi:predicted oxidoreductase
MDRITIAEDLSFSRIVYGMWRLGDDADTSPAHVQAKIEACLEQGITTMDQADIYGGYEAEEILGNALRAAPHLKEKVEIVTKCNIVAPVGRYADARVKHYDTSAAHISQSVEDSLRLMDVERIDMLLMHRQDPMMDHDETGGALDALVASGKVRQVGVSNFRPWDIDLLQSAMNTRLATNQIEISVLENSSFTNGDIAYLQQHRIPPMAWSPLAGGALFASENRALHDSLAGIAARQDADVAALAVAWLMAHPARIMPVMGTNNLERIGKLGEAMQLTIDRETWFEIYTAAIGEEVP